MRHLIIGVWLCCVLSGCNLGNNAPADVTQTPAPTKTLALDTMTTAQPDNVIPSATAAIPDTPSATTGVGTPTATERTCTPQAEWEEYEIQRGDNLTRIATLTGSTVDELIAANCLENPNAIRAGQILYVPQVAQTPTAPPSATPP